MLVSKGIQTNTTIFKGWNMDSHADWSETPPGQVGNALVDEIAAEEDAKHVSSGLSDAVDGIDIEVDDEDRLLGSPTPSVASESTIEILVPVKSGLLPTNLPPTMQAIDARSRVPMLTESAHGSNDLDKSNLTSNDLNVAKMTSNDPATTGTTPPPAPTTTQQVILTRTKPQVMTVARSSNMSSSNSLPLIGNVDDYALDVPIVAKWKYVPNPPGVTRMPFRGLEGHVRSRLTPTDRTNLQMSAHRNGSKF